MAHIPGRPLADGIESTVVPEHTRNEKTKRPGFLRRDPGLVGFELQGVRLCAPLARMLPIDLAADLGGQPRERALAVERQRAVGGVAEGEHDRAPVDEERTVNSLHDVVNPTR